MSHQMISCKKEKIVYLQEELSIKVTLKAVVKPYWVKFSQLTAQKELCLKQQRTTTQRHIARKSFSHRVNKKIGDKKVMGTEHSIISVLTKHMLEHI